MTVFFLIGMNALYAREINICFVPEVNKLKLKPGHEYILSGQKINIETLRFYVSRIQLFKDDHIVFTEVNSFHLIDVADSITENIALRIPDECDFNNISFNLGIDSITNSAGAMGNDLDPTKEMYWAWQSGYINVKLEGTSTSCRSANNEFQFHLGGFQSPFNAARAVKLEVKTAAEIVVALNLDNLLNSSELKLHTHVMSPGEYAMQFSDIIANSFYIKR